MSKILSHRWALPAFSIFAAAGFITVHLTAGEWREAPSLSTGGGGGESPEKDEGVRPFTYVPTSTPNEIDLLIPVPTTIVFGHNVPQEEAGGGPESAYTWNIPYGMPTPDPAQLIDFIGNPFVHQVPPPYPRPLEFGTSSPSVILPMDKTLTPTLKTSEKPLVLPTSAPATERPIVAPSLSPTIPPAPELTRTPFLPPSPPPVQQPIPVLPPPASQPSTAPAPGPQPNPPAGPGPKPGPLLPDLAPTPGSGSSVIWTSHGFGPTWYSADASSVTTPKPSSVPHNQVFLNGCDPLNCTLNESAKFHAMSHEDESIYEIFYTNPIKCCRVIVEIGAGNGDRNSFSYFFEQGLKWKSLLIEANPDLHKELKLNRPQASTINGAFCESGNLQYNNNAFSSLGGSVEISSEIHSPPKIGSEAQEIPCLSMDSVLADNGITKVDVMVIRLQGDALAFIRAMDWSVRVDIWVVLMHGVAKVDRDEIVRRVLVGNEYVQAEWDIKRWCDEKGNCLNNEVFLRKGFNPLPYDVQEAMAAAGGKFYRRLRGNK